MEEIWFEEFYAQGLITDVIAELRSGKEATIFMCSPGAAADAQFLAVKSYRERRGRGFQNRAAYQLGRIMGGSRESRAVAGKSRFGHRVEEASGSTMSTARSAASMRPARTCPGRSPRPGLRS